jgi:cation diffusion facilitator CzcD-associated flavoprotein CzcO
MKTTCIIGAGITGLLTLLLLKESGADVSAISIVDPYFDGGDLARKWTTVLSNTPWSRTIEPLLQACPSLSGLTSPHDPASTTTLIEIANFICKAAAPIMKQVKCVQGTATSANYSSETKEWSITVTVGETTVVLPAKQLILAPGGTSKTLNLAIPTIPVEIALDSSRLKQYIKPADKVIVFGTMHSGTIVIRNLSSLGAEVSAFYTSPEPFYWARNNAYDGIKGEAADIADGIVAGTIPVSLIPIKHTADVIRSSRDATWVVYAMGFVGRHLKLCVDGAECSSKEYNEQTGRLTHAPAWGFGLAYPNRAPDGVHWDVGVTPFLEHIKQQIPSILSDATA